jgi:AcrR family transcriptional regulator
MTSSAIIVWRGERRRAAILNAARRAFLRDGYQNTLMETVADDANVSKTTIYKNFVSKDRLFVAVCEEESRRTLGALFEAIEIDGDFRSALATLAHRIVAVLTTDDLIAFHRLVVAETASFPDIGAAAYECAIRQTAEHVTALFRRAMEHGELKPCDPALAAAQFLALCLSRTYWQKLFGVESDSADLETDAGHTVATFLAAFGAPRR